MGNHLRPINESGTENRKPDLVHNLAKSVYQNLWNIEADSCQREHTWSREPVQEKKSP